MRRDETASLLLLQLMVIVLKTSFGAEILNAEDQKLVVDLHNELRRREGAANMKLMVRTNKCYACATVITASEALCIRMCPSASEFVCL